LYLYLSSSNYLQSKIFEALDRVQGVVRVRLQVAELDLNLVLRFLEGRTLECGSGTIIA
jgi:hypothetical protein